jgi:hypothetical protein
MKHVRSLVLPLALTLPVSSTFAQEAPAAAPAPGEPALLTLPMGSRVRLQSRAAPGQWMKGVLVRADSASVAIVPEDAPPLGANQLSLPSASVGRFELKTGSKRQWLWGLAAGAALGLVFGATADVDSVACKYDYDYACSRGEALAIYGLGTAALGAGVGALIKTDRWMPVALEALAPPAPRVSGVTPRLRVLPGGDVALGLTVGF